MTEIRPKRLNIFKTVLIVLFATVVLVPALLFVFAGFYREQIKAYILEKVNSELSAPVSVSEKADVNIFQQFPYISLEFNHVLAREAVNRPEKDTLFYFRNLYLGFNIFDLLKKNFNIKKISAQKGVVKIARDKEGRGNYNILKTRSDSAKSVFSLALDEVRFSQVRLSYRDENLKQEIVSMQEKIKLNGKFSEKNFNLNISGNGIIVSFSQNGKYFLRDKKSAVQLLLNVDSEKGIYVFEKGKVNIADMQVSLTGTVRSANAGGKTELKIEGKNFSIAEAVSLLPAKTAEKLKDYKSDGALYFSADYSGKGNLSSIRLGFGIENGEITYKPAGISLEKVSVQGVYEMQNLAKTETVLLSVSSFHAALAEGRLSGALSVKNLKSPQVQATLDSEFDLRELARFLQLNTLEEISGNAVINTSFRAAFNDLSNITSTEISRAVVSGNASLRNATLKLKNNKRKLENLNGDFDFHNNELKIENFTGSISGTDFTLSGYFHNIFQYFLLPDEQLYINASASSNLINLDRLLSETNETQTGQEEYHLALSPRLSFDFMLSAKELRFRQFSASDISGDVKLKDGFFSANNLSFRSMNGTAKASLSLLRNPAGDFDMICNTTVEDIDINRLFFECENFGQKFITNENLRGNVTASINLKGVLSPALKLDLSTLAVRSNLAVNKGELVNFKPFNELSKFIKVDDLEHVKFASMSNNIEIKNRKVIIPLMKIQSSALDLDISGTHGFDNAIEYHFRVFLSDILFGKARKAKKENEEFAYVEDDGRGKTSLYLTMKGTSGNYKFSYDSKSVREKIKSDMKRENQNMKALLREEFGLFKKDTALSKTKDPEKKTELKIEWDEMPDSLEKSKKSKQKEMKKVKANPNKKQESEIKIEFD